MDKKIKAQTKENSKYIPTLVIIIQGLLRSFTLSEYLNKLLDGLEIDFQMQKFLCDWTVKTITFVKIDLHRI